MPIGTMYPCKPYVPTVGLIFCSRTDRKYTITEVNKSGFKIGNAKISYAMIQRIRAGLMDGKEYAFQCNGSHGGISYTVAIEAGVHWALSGFMVADKARRVFKFDTSLHLRDPGDEEYVKDWWKK